MKAHPFIGAVVGVCLLWIFLRWFEGAMIYFPSRTITAHPGSYGLPWERVWLTASDGARLRAWFIPAARVDAPAMLCLHGNGGNLSDRVEKMRIFHAAGAAQLWVDWRGYGESSGRPSEAGLYRDAQAARDWLTSAKGVPPSRLVLYGESLGAGAAVELASRAPAAGLIVDSGLTSIADMAHIVLPWFPRSLIRTRFDNLSKLPNVKIPTLFLHSPQDEIVPYEMARRNFAAAGGPKGFVDLKGNHNEGFLDTGDAYGAAIRDFLASLKTVK
ncbi:MAG: alpha/beta hydrolase [Elusimicrobiota bacterium]